MNTDKSLFVSKDAWSSQLSSLLSVEEAQAKLLGGLSVMAATESVALSAANGCVLAEDVISEVDVPSADLSMMDGYALNHDSLALNTYYPVSQRIPAGQREVSPLTAQTVARIFTGAMIPEGATAVVMQEDTQHNADGWVAMSQPIRAGQMIRRQGSDIAQGQTLFPKGKRLTPADIGVCASIGQAWISIREPLSVALITTGDELVTPGKPLERGQSYDANQYLLQAMLMQQGYDVITYSCPDDRDATTAIFTEAADVCDVIISTGGVSVGEEDHVRAVVAQLGEIEAWRVRMKPGKPFAFGQVLGKRFFGLPGNPVAAFTTAQLFVLPALAALQGLTHIMPAKQRVRANFDVSVGDRRDYLRVRLVQEGDQWLADLYRNQASSALYSVSWAEGFVPVAEHSEIHRGDWVDFIPFQ